MTRARTTATLLAAALLSVAACGGGSDGSQDTAAGRPMAAGTTAGSTTTEPGASAAAQATDPATPVPTGEAAKISDLARYVALTPEAPDVCRNKLSAKFVTTVFSSVKRCLRVNRQDDDPSDDAIDVKVTEIRVSGLAATATVTEYLRDGDTVGGTWAFIRAGDVWRVAAWGVDYMRAGFRKAFGPGYRSDGPTDLLGHAGTRACIGDWFEQQDDAAFTRLAHGILRSDKRISRQMRNQMLDCGSIPDAGGTSGLRQLFEHGLRLGAAENDRADLLDCMVRRSRAAITEAHLAEMERAGKLPVWLDRRVKSIGLDCALAEVRRTT